MLDRVDKDLNKMLSADDKVSIALEFFLQEPQIQELDKMIKTARELAKNYQGYDFTEDLEDIL